MFLEYRILWNILWNKIITFFLALFASLKFVARSFVFCFFFFWQGDEKTRRNFPGPMASVFGTFNLAPLNSRKKAVFEGKQFEKALESDGGTAVRGIETRNTEMAKNSALMLTLRPLLSEKQQHLAMINDLSPKVRNSSRFLRSHTSSEVNEINKLSDLGQSHCQGH